MPEQTSKSPWSLWTISSVMLLYNAAGVVNFISQMSAESVSALPEPYRALIEARPVWATVAFAVAVFGGALGCVLLLLRRSIAYHVFVASLAGATVTMVHTLGLLGPVAAPPGFVVGNLVQLVVTVFLIWYARWTRSKGWIS